MVERDKSEREWGDRSEEESIILEGLVRGESVLDELVRVELDGAAVLLSRLSRPILSARRDESMKRMRESSLLKIIDRK